MSDIVQILLSALSVIVAGLCALAVTKFTEWINRKISDKKAANYLATIVNLTMTSVKCVYQTYVETLKAEGSFDKEAQKKALDNCLLQIKRQLAPELIDYITLNFGDMDEYLKSLIESTIYTLKAGN